ncbi:hypothetical protein [Xanthomonas phage BUDD]|nr:hypothetical protein [Xanthomonas phage BUDD]
MSGDGQIRTDLLTRAEFDRNCRHYAEWAYYTPPDRFIFHYWEDSVEEARICERPMLGMERYVVSGTKGGHYGIYDTRDVTFYLKTRTWIEIPSEKFFAEADVAEAQRKLDEAKQRLEALK